jgi:tetratricopeptide (TPR) repeat protein
MRVKFPGTGEIITIEMPVYQPVALSLQWMEKYLSLMQIDKPDLATTQIMADVNSWLGNTHEAVEWWRLLISMQPGNDSLRNEAVRYFTSVNFLTDAYAQLDTLNKRNILQQDQQFQLAQYHMLAGKYQPALHVLQLFSPVDTIQMMHAILLKANIHRLMGNPNMALDYLNDSMPVVAFTLPEPLDSLDSFATLPPPDEAQVMYANTAYAKARIYASARKYKNALAELRKALDNGFNYGYLLDEDKVWDQKKMMRKKNKLVAKFTFEREYKTEATSQFENPIGYRIPNWPKDLYD